QARTLSSNTVETTTNPRLKRCNLSRSVPVPRVYHVRECKGITFIEMEFVPGREAYVWYTMPQTARQALLKELESYVKQILSLSPPAP
ncbi:hypothetical protein B0H17DRAFT_1261437, partial [Mycena rosella]